MFIVGDDVVLKSSYQIDPAHASRGHAQMGLRNRGSARSPQSLLQVLGVIGNRQAGRLLRSGDHFDGPRAIRALGGELHTGAHTDVSLRLFGARAATLANRVYVRSDILAAPETARNEKTFAHEAMHLLQQHGASGTPRPPSHRRSDAEREAESGASELLSGNAPRIVSAEERPVARFQFDQEFDQANAPMSLADAVQDPLWVESGIHNYFIPDLKTPEMIIIYTDGNILRIPLKYVTSDTLGSGGTVTMFRRQKFSGRLVPFAISQTDLFSAAEGKKGGSGARLMHELVPPRFDPTLTPLIVHYVDAELARLAVLGFLNVAKLHVGGALVKGAIRAGAAGGLFTTPRVVAGGITAGANVLDQALSYGSDWSKYNWGSVGFDFVFGMVTQTLVAKLFVKWPAPIFSKKALELQTWKNFGWQQGIFATYGTVVGLLRSEIGNTSRGKTVASQHLEGALQAAKSGAVDSFLKSKVGLQQFPLGKNDVRVIFVSKLVGLVIKASTRQAMGVTPTNEPEEQPQPSP